MPDHISDLVDQEQAFTYRGRRYVLREPSESANIKFQRTQFQNAKVVDGKISGTLEQAIEATSVLVGECTFAEGSETPVGATEVRGWSKRLVKALFERARQMSGEAGTEVQQVEAEIVRLQGVLETVKAAQGEPKN